MTDSAVASAHIRDEDSALQATFVPGAGMICTSLRCRGEELLAQRAGLDAYVQRGKTMGIPLLYPWANRLAGFRYSVLGRTVVVPHDPARTARDPGGLPIHGVIGGRMTWELMPAPGPGTLVAELSWSESKPELFEVFPFRHDLRYEARLIGGSLEVELTVHACGADCVPLAFGFHPYLSLPGVPRGHWLVELPSMRRLALDSRQIPLGPEQSLPAQRLELGERAFDDAYDQVAEPARFAVTAARRRIVLEFLEGYPCAQLFTPAGGQFICFEPMSAPTNALLSGSGLRLLAAGERHRARFSLRVQDLSPSRSNR